jgi:hypothetical protein
MEGFFMPKDTTQKPTPTAAAPNALQPERQTEPGASNVTVAVLEKIAKNPRFKEVKGTKGYVFFGDHLHEQSKGCAIKRTDVKD